jgi:hypothetical protein
MRPQTGQAIISYDIAFAEGAILGSWDDLGAILGPGAHILKKKWLWLENGAFV